MTWAPSGRTLVPLWEANVQANPPFAPPDVQEAVQQGARGALPGRAAGDPERQGEGRRTHDRRGLRGGEPREARRRRPRPRRSSVQCGASLCSGERRRRLPVHAVVRHDRLRGRARLGRRHAVRDQAREASHTSAAAAPLAAVRRGLQLHEGDRPASTARSGRPSRARSRSSGTSSRRAAGTESRTS